MKRNLCFLLAATVSSAAFGHGYIVDSRSHQCSTGGNSGCGAIQYEPQSVEGDDRFPATGPADGRIASGGRNWEPLDAQTPTRWNKVNMKSGAHTFRWNYTAPHSTRDWRYFITKQDWDPTQPLTRASFDLAPFCSFSGNNQAAPNPSLHNCNIPQRSGYQVILGVWDVADTGSSFYSVVDAQFDGSNPPVDPPTPPEPPEPPTPPQQLNDVGDINPSQALRAGAQVTLRLFTAQGELSNRSISMTISNNSQGAANNWPKLFAEHINARNTEIKAGLINQQGQVVPAVGKNDVFVPRNSSIVRTEVSIENNDGGVAPTLNVVLNQDKFVAGSAMNVVANITTNQRMNVSAKLFYQGVAIAMKDQANVLGDTVLNINVADPKVGEYQLITTAQKVDGDNMLQKTLKITVAEKPVTGTTPTYDDAFGSIKTGDKVIGYDGNTYQCLIAGWCNGSRQYYAPGTGLAWQQAWKQVSDDGTPPVSNPKYVYPSGKGEYTAGVVVKGSDGENYRCKIDNWCNGSTLYYAPGTGLAWQQAWTKI